MTQFFALGPKGSAQDHSHDVATVKFEQDLLHADKVSVAVLLRELEAIPPGAPEHLVHHAKQSRARSDPGLWTSGCTCTTTIGTTPPSEDRPQVASTTWWAEHLGTKSAARVATKAASGPPIGDALESVGQ